VINSERNASSTRPKQATVMLLNGRGDYLLNLPALRAISNAFEGRVVWVVKKNAHEYFFSDLPAVRILEPEFKMSEAGPLFDAPTLATDIGSTDIFLSLNPWHTDSVDDLLNHISASHTVGFFPGFDSQVPLDFSKHSSDLAFDIARCLAPNFEMEAFSQHPQPAGRHVELANSLRTHLPCDAKIIVVHGETKPEKMWDDTKFIEIIRWLLNKNPRIFVFDLGLNSIGGDKLLSEPRFIPCQELILPAAIALVAHADLFVGIDSCFLHAADLYRVPGVGLFGPTSPNEFGFRFGPHRHEQATKMQNITTKEVMCAIDQLIADESSLTFLSM